MPSKYINHHPSIYDDFNCWNKTFMTYLTRRYLDKTINLAKKIQINNEIIMRIKNIK